VETDGITSSSSSSSTFDPLEEYVKSHGGDRVIRKVLIANNGMAATKSILSMRQWAYMELGDERAIQFVAMATPEDLKANAEFVRLADAFVEVPGGVNRNNYANVDVIVKVALDMGVDAVWPGWGHASENPKLPNTLLTHGIKFIGPTGPVMSVLGDKIAANILAQTAKVPSIPWSGSYGGPDDGPLQAELNEEGTIPEDIFEKATCRTVEQAVTAAERIGYENGIMIKASEGGGGKGIRFVENEKDLRNAYVQVTNEVVGSPIFIMQLCKNARHLEVQIVGDQHGNAVALNGRDCSTQRRFQKIFEEGPPVIAPKETFREMEKAAQRLTQNIGYIGAGTVEYLFNADTGKYFFLELNPRLQVEHPVTEGITGVNMPATQLQVAMGIPLNRIPEIRKLYGRPDVYGSDTIDFLEEDYKPIDSHVIAARITAENPDEGFKPTSGRIERIKFQSSSNVWGYFSVGSNGGIHEFADSQFGHLFAKGPTREAARRALVLALKEIEVRGEIRTTVEYLVQLLETKEFKENTIDTSWLDGLIKAKGVTLDLPTDLVVISAAIFKADEHVKAETAAIIESFEKGQVGTSSIPKLQSFETEVAYKDVKYHFHVERLASDIYRFKLNGNGIDVRVTKTAEAALIANFAGETHRIFGQEEPLGLRLVVDGTTLLMPSVFDPSELRTDVTGKVVRYLQDSGTSIEVGQPFVEVEAMKMIMPVKATESGRITNNLSPGSIISAGDLLATLELKDPSKVKKIITFDGSLAFDSTPLDTDAKDLAAYLLAGYKHDPEKVAQDLLAGVNDPISAAELALNAVNEFLRVETVFDGLLKDEVIRELTKANKANLGTVIDLAQAQDQLLMREKFVSAVLRQVDNFATRVIRAPFPEEFVAALTRLTTLKGKAYGELKLIASDMILKSKILPFEDRQEELRKTLLNTSVKLDELAKSPGISSGVDLLSSLFADADATVRKAAVEVYVRRVYRAYRMVSLVVEESDDGRLMCTWKFQPADAKKSSYLRQGTLSVVKSLGEIGEVLNHAEQQLDVTKPMATEDEEYLNTIHIALIDAQKNAIGDIDAAVRSQEGKLVSLGIRLVNVLVPVAQKDPLYYSFPHCDGYKEDILRRNMRPTLYSLLELARLKNNYELERLEAVGKNAQVYIATEKISKPVRGGAPQSLFVRGISHTHGLVSIRGAQRALIQGLDELERAQSNPKVKSEISSHIFLHSLPEITGVTAVEVAEKFQEIMGIIKSRLAQRLLKLSVDEIEVIVRVAVTDEDGDAYVQPVRLVASSMGGEWLKTVAYLDIPNPVTGVTEKFCTIGDDAEVCVLDPYAISNAVQTKRAIARRVGSTYAYDFLGLLEVGLIGEWEEHLRSMGESNDLIPGNALSSQELFLGTNGELTVGSWKEIGTNKIGMVAWVVTMKSPEYPEGRDVVFIANDVTVQSGSFGVEEDDFFFKASEYARHRKIPRVYIACNSGARIGLVDELKPLIQIKWADEKNPNRGFDYLYLTDDDYKGLPAGTVIARKVSEGWAIEDIIGTKSGIGVENLRGSGMIAGETSRAYDEIFTLSYVTGRSVGIGAYLVRLGQRVIQMQTGPLILTGYSALNKLLGREVYVSQDQLGGPQVMVPNGVTHEEVPDDQAGVASILKWLSFVPKSVGELPASRPSADPVSRDVVWRPTRTPYDPRLMLSGTSDMPGFFDQGSFKEYLSGWGKSVVIGRGRLGGIPMGAIAVETRLVDKVVPADPADPNSREAILPQAGQVLFPDSSYKVAQAIRDFDKEGVPLMMFANWRGFSGGSRDMAGEILKFGAMIVDALREYSNPVFVYLPPYAELRGGSWVVVDPTINEEKMTMFADPLSRGGILEPAGIIEVKFRKPDIMKVMRRTDEELRSLEADMDACAFDSDIPKLKDQIKAREDLIYPVYSQIATEFADAHDKTGRMKAKGVIKDAVEWSRCREFFYYLTKRRITQDDLVNKMKVADPLLDTKTALEILKSLCPTDWEDDKATLEFFTSHADDVNAKMKAIKRSSVQSRIDSLNAELEAM
jgi:acetyl-CoA carboxylase/biotin carboxylase 1